MLKRLQAWVAEHGETARDVRGLVHGKAHANEPLNAAGRRQALRLGERMRRMRPSAVYASPARRALQTAQIAAGQIGVPVKTAPDLRSLDTGDIPAGNQVRVAAKLRPYFEDQNKPIPGAGTVAEWRERHLGFMRRMATKAMARGERPPLFVTHSNVVGSAVGGTAEAGRRAMADPPMAATPKKVDLSGAAGRPKP